MFSIIFLLAISKEDQNLNRGVVGQIAAYSEDSEFSSGIAALKDIKGVLDFIK
ncbi:hypothetical protein ACTNDN_11300 [Niallia sp. HCP3S3_B10]|uniref:hypothetical protein n=1 Tax=Niallia sp. HCP3S3_B10 TaxID=3438944 RepID=UPI003F8BC665